MKNKTHNGFRVRQEGYRQVIQLPTKWLARIFVFLFMTVWLSGWSAGCGMMLRGLVVDFSWFLLLFSIPFFAGWFFGVSTWLSSLFGRERLILEKDYLEIESSVLVPVKRKRIPYEEILAIKLTHLEGLSTINIESTGKPLTFGSGHKVRVLEELREYLLKEVPIANRVNEPDLAEDPVRFQRRTVKPESSQWQLEVANDRNGTEFVNRGAFEFGATIVFLGFALFWNGIVGVFVFKVIQAWRGLGDQPASVGETLFLIPFVLIGIVIFLLLLFTLLEPFRKTVYGFSSREMYRQSGYFGFSRTKIWPVMLGVTMESECKFEDDPSISGGTNYLLRFVQENEKLVEIGELTLAEACWIATEIETRESSYTWDPSND